MKKKITAGLLGIILLSLAGCGTAATPKTDWKSLYLGYLDSLQNDPAYQDAESNGFRLYDMNNDGIPELIWDSVDFSDHFLFLTCKGDSVQEIDQAGRRAVGYELAWDVAGTEYYVKEFDTGFAYSFSLCKIENGDQSVLLTVNDTNNDLESDYTRPFVCQDENGNEIGEDEFRNKFKKLTGNDIGDLASDSGYLLSDESYLVNMLDPAGLVSEEEIRASLNS